MCVCKLSMLFPDAQGPYLVGGWSLYGFPEVEVEWADALPFKIGVILKANLPPPH